MVNKDVPSYCTIRILSNNSRIQCTFYKLFHLDCSFLFNSLKHLMKFPMCLTHNKSTLHDDVIKWKYFPRYWPFVRGIHRSPANSPHKGQWRGDLMLSLLCVWINGWVNNREAGDLRRYHALYDVIVMGSGDQACVGIYGKLQINLTAISVVILRTTHSSTSLFYYHNLYEIRTLLVITQIPYILWL